MKNILALLLVCTSALASDAEIFAAEAAVRAEKAKLAEHVKGLASVQSKANLPNQTPQEREYIAKSIAAHMRFIQESHTRIAQSEAALARIKVIKAQAAQKIATPEQKPAPVQAPKPVAAQPLKVVTLNDGKTIEILRFIETENEYNVQTPDKKFSVIAKDLVKSIEDKVDSGVKD